MAASISASDRRQPSGHKWMRILRDPLLHFIVLGALVFTADRSGLFDRTQVGAPEDAQIIVTQRDIAHLEATWTVRHNRPPTADERRSLIDQFIAEERLTREAQRLGLHEDDTVIRRRLAQKMRFLFADLAEPPTPDEAALRTHYEAHKEKYRTPDRISFRHIYFNTDDPAREAAADQTIPSTRAALDAAPERWHQLGDPTMLPRSMQSVSLERVTHQFGAEFAAALEAVQPGAWQGPLPSALGLHLVDVTGRHPGGQQPFKAVRDQVTEDVRTAARDKAMAQLLAGLAQAYPAIIETPTKEELR